MAKRVQFYLGPALGLSGRRLKVTRMAKAGDVVPLSATYDNTFTSEETTASVALADNTIWQATLQDTKTTGEVGKTHVLNFNTGSLQFPGPACDASQTLFRIMSMEDKSSSSSSSYSSSSSSSGHSSSSSSVNSSSSSSSSSGHSSSSSSSGHSSSSSSSGHSSSSSSSSSTSGP